MLEPTTIDQNVEQAARGRGAAASVPTPRFDAGKLLEPTGLRPTRHRLALATLLFGNGHRHLTAEMLFEEASASATPVTLATVYNTLNSLAEVGLLRRVCVDGSKTYYDTNVAAHQHFYCENSHELIDIPENGSFQCSLPAVPEEYEVIRVDVIVRIRKKRAPST